MIRAENDGGQCRKLWDRMSPARDAWDDWDLMFAFHDEKKHRFHFLVHEDAAGEPDGVVPLVYDTTEKRFMLMAGSYPDGRVLWLRYEDFPEFFETLPEPTVFFDLKKSWVDGLLERHPQFEANFGEPETRFFLVPSEFGFDFNNHLELFSSEKRQKFLYDLRKIRKQEPVLRWSDDDEAELFIELVNRNFGDESDYATEDNANELRRVIAVLQRSGRRAYRARQHLTLRSPSRPSVPMLRARGGRVESASEFWCTQCCAFCRAMPPTGSTKTRFWR